MKLTMIKIGLQSVLNFIFKIDKNETQIIKLL